MFQRVYESLPGVLRPLRRCAPPGLAEPACVPRATPSRIEICPPASRPVSSAEDDSWREHLGRWIDTAWPGLLASTRAADSSKVVLGPVPLEGVRHEFALSLTDIRCAAARDALYRIDTARSLHELWHLRPEVFNLVSRHHDQTEATTRLAGLNRHFPTRAPRGRFRTIG